MSRVYFVLDSLHADYATVLSALATASANKYSFTPTQVVRSANHDSNIKIVPANINLADRTGDLAPLARGQLGVGVYKDEYIDQPDKVLRAFALLGERSQSAMYIRQETAGGYGDSSGRTYGDAANGWGDTTTLGATFVRGTTYWGCGCNWAFRDGVAFVNVNDMPAFPAGTGATVTWRMDHPLDPGMNYTGFVDRTTTSNTWTRPDAVNHPRVWKATLDNLSGTGSGHFLLPIDPTLSTSDIYENHMFGQGGSQAGVEANVLTAWVNTGTKEMWVHMPDDSDPTDRIGRSNNFGYNPAAKYMDATTAKQDFDFILCQFLGGTMSSGDKFPKARFLGGRYLFKSAWKPFDVCISGTEWGRATDGRVLWDTSDRPDPATDTYIARAVAKSSSQATWDEIDKFIEIDSAEEGVYWKHSGITDNPDDGLVSGMLARHIGDPHPRIKAKFGNTITLDDGDSHAIATQGGSNWTCEYFYIEKAGSAVNFYAISDATNVQLLHDNVFQDFVIINSHNKYSVSTAGMNGININGDGQMYERTNGNGNAASNGGNIVRRGAMAGIVGDPTAHGGDGYSRSGTGVVFHNYHELFIDSVDVEASNCVGGQNNADMAKGEGGTPDVTNPAQGSFAGYQSRAHNCTWRPLGLVMHQRAINWDPAAVAISSITKANPAVVTTSAAHGFPDIAQADVYIEPEIYFNVAGMTELNGTVYKAVWISTTQFSLKTLAGANVDSTGFGTFTSGDCARSNRGYIDLQSNEIVLSGGLTASSDLYKYKNALFTLAELQALSRSTLPGSTSEALESGTTIV